MFLLAVLDLERLRVVARAVAGRAGRIDARQEEQLDHHEAFALAVLAAALGDVEREPPGVVAAGPRRLGRGEELADVVEQARVGGEVRARRAADRLLVDAHQSPDALHAADDPPAGGGRRPAAPARRRPRPPTRARGPRCSATSSTSDLADQARLARARDAGDGREHAEREGDVELVQVVAGDARQAQPALRRARRPRGGGALPRTGSGGSATPRPRARPAGRAAVEDLAAVLAGGRADVDDPVGVADHVELVLDDEERVAGRLQRSSARSSASVSAGCSPADGSSST